LNTLNYAPRPESGSFPIGQARAAGITAIVTPLIGLVILGACWLTNNAGFALVGGVWLCVGGLLVLFSFTSSVVGLFFNSTWQRNAPARRWVLVGLIASVLSVPTAMFCAIAGMAVLEKEVSFVVRNANDFEIDELIVHSLQGDVHLGKIPPRTTVTRQTDLSSVESTSMTLVVDGARRQVPLEISADSDQPSADVVIEPSMLDDQ
jgi:hypothetical protein